MGIESIVLNTIGTASQDPVWIYINAENDTDDEITTPGYLDEAASQGFSFTNGQCALVKTVTGVSIYDVVVTRVGRTITYSLVLNTDGSVTNVLGTADQITSTGGFTPQIGLWDLEIGAGSVTNANITYDTYGRIRAISSGSSTNLPFSTVTTSGNLAANHGYFINSVSRVDLLLPASFNVGDQIWIISLNNSPWRITQRAGQHLVYGAFASTVGTGGYVDSLGPDATTNCGTVTFVGSTANTVMSVGVAPSNTLNFQ